MPQESERTTQEPRARHSPICMPCAEATSGEGKTDELLHPFPRVEGDKAELSPWAA